MRQRADLPSHVGNTMAEFVMQSLGCDVAALNTVHFSAFPLIPCRWVWLIGVPLWEIPFRAN